jgi:hypothetical protein
MSKAIKIYLIYFFMGLILINLDLVFYYLNPSFQLIYTYRTCRTCKLLTNVSLQDALGYKFLGNLYHLVFSLVILNILLYFEDKSK